MATEQRFVVHYPNYATRLDNFSVENKLSRHARQRSAAVRQWDRDVIPALILLLSNALATVVEY
ncbi:hypothetical protein BS47DRAFT_1402111 [Hydnum rufescens UP504]|uniref:Uncharacterized protein n=1 Tax=Hydnum rufescens UP504 TaxID=1448309 RepID=A0A9P6ADH9_9AGAM|nr:hypothetical protein BS47DRAFT_1402111 [Hydnum rufescens UP504]